GESGIFVVAPQGNVIGAMRVPAAYVADDVLKLLERLKGPEGAPALKPGPMSRPRLKDDLVLRLVARYVDPAGAPEKVRGTYHEYPAENRLVLSRSDAARLLPVNDRDVGLEWPVDPGVSSTLLTHFYPVTEDASRDDAARSSVERLQLRGRIV